MSSLKEYVEKLNCADEAERTYAAEDIGYLNAPDGVPALLERLGKEPSRAVRDAIFQALIRIDADAAIEGSIRLLGSEDPQIRNQAVDVLRRKGARSIPFLNTVMRDGDKDMRKLVLDVLSGIQAGDAGEIYAAALSDEDANVVITAVENLGRIRAAEFRSRIEESAPGRLAPHADRRLPGGTGWHWPRILVRGHPPPFPGFGGAAGLPSGVLPESDCRPGISQGVRRGGEPAARARPSPSPRDSGCAHRHLSALPVARPRRRSAAGFTGGG